LNNPLFVMRRPCFSLPSPPFHFKWISSSSRDPLKGNSSFLLLNRRSINVLRHSLIDGDDSDGDGNVGNHGEGKSIALLYVGDDGVRGDFNVVQGVVA